MLDMGPPGHHHPVEWTVRAGLQTWSPVARVTCLNLHSARFERPVALNNLDGSAMGLSFAE
jgi:hypothetical protein